MDPAEDEGEPLRRGPLAAAVVAAAALVFTSGIAIVPWLESRAVDFAPLLRLSYAPLCHQLPERSFEIASRPAAVCARCSGLYVGGVAGLLLALGSTRRWGRPKAWWLAVALAPSAIDFALASLALPALPNLPRALAGVPAGLVAGLFLSIGVEEWFESRNGAERAAPGGLPSVREG